MATFWWTAEAGATAGDETTVTAANSGTDGPTSVNSVSGGTRAFDSAQAMHGSWSCKLATGATSGTSNLVWGTTRIGSPSQAWFAIYYRFSEMLSNRSLARIRSGTTQICRLHRTADGRIELRDSGNSVAVGGTGTVSMSADTWYRIEIHAVPGTTSTCTVRLYAGDSTTLLDEITPTDNFSSATTVTEITVGNIAAGANIPDYWVDDVRFSDVGWPGPAITTHDADTDLDGTGALSATATVERSGAAPLDGVGALSATAAVTSPIGNLVDDFDDNSIDTAKWPGNYGGIAETGQQLVIDCDVAQWSGLKSATVYWLDESAVFLRAYPPDKNTASVAYLSVLVTTTTAGTDAGFNIDGTGIAFLNRVGFSDGSAVFDTYSATDHAWLRLREASGTLYWETSPDGSTWTQRRSAPSPSWVTDTDLALLVESHRDAGTDNTAAVDNVNVVPFVTHNADTDLAAVGALTASATVERPASTDLAVVADLDAAATTTQQATASLAATAALTAAGVPARHAAAAMQGTADLAAAATVTDVAATALTGGGALAATADAQRHATATLDGAGELSAGAAVDLPATASLAATAALGGSATTGQTATAGLTTGAALTGTATADRAADAVLSTAGLLAAAASADRNASIGLSAAGTLTAAGAVTGPTAPVDLAGVGDLTAAAAVARPADATLTSVGQLAAAAATAIPATTPLSAAGTLSAAAGLEVAATAALSAAGTLTAAGGFTQTAAAALPGVAELVASTAAVRPATAVLAGTGTLAAVGEVGDTAPISPPDTGVVARPSAGTVTRPATGTISRPDTGTVTRPDTGLILQP